MHHSHQSYSVSFPDNADIKEISSMMKDGVITIEIQPDTTPALLDTKRPEPEASSVAIMKALSRVNALKFAGHGHGGKLIYHVRRGFSAEKGRASVIEKLGHKFTHDELTIAHSMFGLPTLPELGVYD